MNFKEVMGQNGIPFLKKKKKKNENLIFSLIQIKSPDTAHKYQRKIYTYPIKFWKSKSNQMELINSSKTRRKRGEEN